MPLGAYMHSNFRFRPKKGILFQDNFHSWQRKAIIFPYFSKLRMYTFHNQLKSWREKRAFLTHLEEEGKGGHGLDCRGWSQNYAYIKCSIDVLNWLKFNWIRTYNEIWITEMNQKVYGYGKPGDINLWKFQDKQNLCPFILYKNIPKYKIGKLLSFTKLLRI